MCYERLCSYIFEKYLLISDETGGALTSFLSLSVMLKGEIRTQNKKTEARQTCGLSEHSVCFLTSDTDDIINISFPFFLT